jgi:hypothetical protein
MRKTVVGLMKDEVQAHAALCDLLEQGFDRELIGLMTRDAGSATAETVSPLQGARAGAAVGAVGGLLVGLAARLLPGVGPIVAAGPVAAALAGAGVGAVTGGVVGALRGMGVPDEDAQCYAEGVRRGGALVTADVADDEEARLAAVVMRTNGAADIERLARTWRQEGWRGFDEAAGPYALDRAASE